MGELKQRLIVLAGAALLALVGRDRFYQMAQAKPGILGRLAAAFCSGHGGRLGQNYHIYAENKDVDRISAIALRYYGDDSLHGYGDVEFTRSDGKALVDQQRGLVIPLVAAAVERDRPKLVLEIGAGNGDVVAHLAAGHPAVQFVGCDLSVKNGREAPAAEPELRQGLRARSAAGSKPRARHGLRVLDLLRLHAEGAPGVSRRDAGRRAADRLRPGDVRQRPHPRPTTAVAPHGPVHVVAQLLRLFHGGGFRVENHQTVPFAYSWNPGVRVVLVDGRRP